MTPRGLSAAYVRRYSPRTAMMQAGRGLERDARAGAVPDERRHLVPAKEWTPA